MKKLLLAALIAGSTVANAQDITFATEQATHRLS